MMSQVSEKRLTHNRIFRHLIVYSQQEFTGKVIVSNLKEQAWCFYFLRGYLIWAYEENQDLERWQRQLKLANAPSRPLSEIDEKAECWDCKELRVLSQENRLSPQQTYCIIKGITEEVLFNLVQAFEAPIYNRFPELEGLLPISRLTGIGDGMIINFEKNVMPDALYRLPYSFFPTLKTLQKTVSAIWEKWVKLGLSQVSPQQAPLLVEPEKLKSQVSEKIYYNMSQSLRGKRSVRDLAIKMKQNGDFVKIAAAIAPHYQKGMITFKELQNTVSKGKNTDRKLTIEQSVKSDSKPLFLAIDADHQNQAFLGGSAESIGYTFEATSDGMNALHKITQNAAFKPEVIFASYEMMMLNPEEFCRIFRRLEGSEQTLILIYSEESIPKPKKVELMEAGANQLILWQKLNSNYIENLLKQHQKKQLQNLVKSSSTSQAINNRRSQMNNYFTLNYA